MQAPTVQQDKIQVDTDGWLWAWYVLSISIIHKFFDGNTRTPAHAEQEIPNLCYFFWSRVDALAVIALQLVAVGGLAWSLTWLPVHFFGIWGYLTFLRLAAAWVIGIIAMAVLFGGVIAHDKRYGYRNAKHRMEMSLTAMGGLALSRLLFWSTLSGDDLNAVNVVVPIGITIAIIGAFGYYVALRNSEGRPLWQLKSGTTRSDTASVARPVAEKQKALGFWKMLWLYAKAAKVRACPLIEPVKKSKTVKKGADL